ncbi:MAG: head GIN domain-containing protein [Cyclobacteriaceae bacterium]
MKKLNLLLLFTACIMMFSFKARSQSIPDISGGFSKLDVSGAYTIYLKKGDKPDVKVEGPEEKMETVKITKRGDMLEIGMKKGKYKWKDNDDVTIYVTYTSLEEVILSGASNISSEEAIKADKFRLKVSGAGTVNMDIDANSITSDISGAGSITLKGTATSQMVEFSGAGSYKAYDLESDDVEVDASGAGTIQVHASDSLKVNASGVGSVKYKGEPATDINTSGMGSVKSAN